MKPTKTWILIADGTRARILLNEGPGKGVKPAVPEEFSAPSRPSREIVSDRPGSMPTPGGGTRHGFAPRIDWHQFEKHRFAIAMAKMLNDAGRRRAFDRLVLVAPPEPLGALRAKLDPAVRTKVTAEIGKDLTSLTPRELAARLGQRLVL